MNGVSICGLMLRIWIQSRQPKHVATYCLLKVGQWFYLLISSMWVTLCLYNHLRRPYLKYDCSIRYIAVCTFLHIITLRFFLSIAGFLLYISYCTFLHILTLRFFLSIACFLLYISYCTFLHIITLPFFLSIADFLFYISFLISQ